MSGIPQPDRSEEVRRQIEERFRRLVEVMPVAVYVCDTSGIIQNYNTRAVELWGREPKLGDPAQQYCGALHLYSPDGKLVPHSESKMAEVLRTGIEARDLEVLIERPDGSRITVLVHSMNAGGAQQRLVALANGFAAAGRKVDFVAVSARGIGVLNLAPEVNQVVLMRSPRGRPRMLRGRRELENYLKRSRPSVLLAGSTTVHPIAVLATRALDTPPALILRASRHPHRPVPWRKPYRRLTNKWRRAFDYWLFDQADKVVAVSHEVGAALRAKMQRPERCLILPNPVVTDAFLENLSCEAPHPWFGKDEPVILGVGRLVWQKNFATLIDAMAKVIRNRPARLILVGEGKLRAELELQADRLGISEHVAMPGHVGSVAAWMKHADLLVSSSRYEGSPGVLIEALAAGCPVVATR